VTTAAHPPYDAVASRLGLAVLPHASGALSLGGAIEGQPVFVQRAAASGAVVVFAELAPELDLGLRVAPSGLAEGLRDLLGAVDAEVGDAAFDAAYAVRADEPERASALLGGPVVEAMLACAPLTATVRDGGVEARLTREVVETGDGESLVHAVAAVTAVARAIDVARRSVQPAAPLARLAGAWLEFASERGLTAVLGAPMLLHGTLHDAKVRVASKRLRRDVHEVEVGVLFEQPLDFHLEVGPGREGVSTWFEPEDVSFEDKHFDERFDVRTDDAERARALLDVNVRATLIELATGPRLSVTSHGIFVTDDALHFAPRTVPMTVELIAGLARDIHRKARGG
jgi:hypothetical protein